MDSSDIFQICKIYEKYLENGIQELNNVLQDQTTRIDTVFNELLQSAQNISKIQSKTKYGQFGDVITAEPSFQQPAIPPIRRTKRQASIIASDKVKVIRESATISGFGASTRASRARALSTFIDIDPIACPAANSTFVVDKKFMKNLEECVSPGIFSSNNDGNRMKETNPNQTYVMPKKISTTNGKNKIDLPKESTIIAVNSKSTLLPSLSSSNSKKKSLETHSKNKLRDKLIDIDVNIEEKSSQYMTRTTKRKLQEENNIDAKKTNVLSVPLEKQISIPIKPLKNVIPETPQQNLREKAAEKRKELVLKSKAVQRKLDDQHLKAAKQREEQMRRVEEKIKKAAEEKKKKEMKQKEKEMMMKEEILKKQKQAEQRLAAANAKRKLAEEEKLLKKPQIAALVKLKIDAKNDYGLNDVSARDSSDDESGPKKPVPNWAKRENRKGVLELQYHIDLEKRDLFFNCPKKMSLQEMFEGWKIRDKKRTSSAIWNTSL